MLLSGILQSHVPCMTHPAGSHTSDVSLHISGPAQCYADVSYCLVLQYQHSVDGKLLRTWNGHQINDLALTADGRFLLATPSNGHAVRVYGLHAPVPVERDISAPSAIVSISLASDSRHLLVSAFHAI